MLTSPLQPIRGQLSTDDLAAHASFRDDGHMYVSGFAGKVI